MTDIKEKVERFAQLNSHKQAAEIEVLIREFASLGVEPLVETAAQAQTDAERPIRWGVAFLLGEIGDVRAIEPLCLMLEDTFPSVRAMAATSLSKLGTRHCADMHAVEPLIKVLREENDAKVLREAASALATMRDSRAIVPLEQIRDAWSKGRKNPPYMSDYFQGCIERMQERLTE